MRCLWLKISQMVAVKLLGRVCAAISSESLTGWMGGQGGRRQEIYLQTQVVVVDTSFLQLMGLPTRLPHDSAVGFP